MTNMNEMMNKMMENMMNKMMETMMDRVFASMLEQFGGAENMDDVEMAFAEIEPEVKKARKLSVEDLISSEKSTSTNEVPAELGYWEGISKDGKTYRWYGWANPETCERVFPGKQLYHVNDFYLKRDYGAYHPGKTTSYKFKNGGLNAVLTQYKVHTEIEPKDAKEFMKFMSDKESKKAERTHDTECYTNWVKTTK